MSESAQTRINEPAATGRSALLRLLRIVLIAVIILVTFFYVLDIGQDPSNLGEWEIGLVTGWPWVLLFALTLAFGVIAIDVLTPEKKIATVSGVFFGIVAGVAAAIALSFLLDRIAEVYEITGTPTGEQIISTIKILIGIATVYLAVSIVLQTQDQFRLVIPYVEFARQIRGPKPLLLDTSVLIDARVLDVAESGVIQSPLVVPQFVLAELHVLADSGDKLKRARGRRGLDTVARLQREARVDVSIDERDVPGGSVDQMLVELAGQMPAMIVTTDSGLGRVAAIQGLQVLNLNELAIALRPNVHPGEQLRVKLIRLGEQSNQGVGYLDDGTMVVAEDGSRHVGETVQLTVASTLQTAAGRMIFGRIGAGDNDGAASPVVETGQDAAPDHHDQHATTPTSETNGRENEPSPRRDPRRSKARNPRR